jgi:hypothetical protein
MQPSLQWAIILLSINSTLKRIADSQPRWLRVCAAKQNFQKGVSGFLRKRPQNMRIEAGIRWRPRTAAAKHCLPRRIGGDFHRAGRAL